MSSPRPEVARRTDRERIDRAIEAFCRKSDRERSFRFLFDTYYRPLLRFFRRKGFVQEDARDLTQETFLRIYKGLEGYRREARFETWLYRVATTTYLKRLRASSTQKRRGHEVATMELEGDPSLARSAATPEPQLSAVLGGERREALRRAVAELPAQMRTALVLRIYQELAYREIAVVMRVSIETVKAHLFQARHKLEKALSEEVDLGPG